MTALIDTGFMFSVLSRREKHHLACLKAYRREPEPLIPVPILPELAYFALPELGYQQFAAFLEMVTFRTPRLVHATQADMIRTAEIMREYADIKIDFADCVIMAMAERLNITRILTIDQRDFRIFRPKHTLAFEILP